MERTQQPFAYVLRKGTIQPQELQKKKNDTPISDRTIEFHESLAKPYSQRPTRTEALKVILDNKCENDYLVATTGKTGRELYTLQDSDHHLYLVGSMGCASSFTLGAALCANNRGWIVLDGDAATLMRMGNLATIGALKPGNFLHVVLDNEVNDSTGGQDSVSREIMLGAIALACGYKKVYSIDSLSELNKALSQRLGNNGPVFIHMRIRKGSPADLGRPKIKPFEVKERMIKSLAQG
jgi:phosphonopyruvate decarboxylase